MVVALPAFEAQAEPNASHRLHPVHHIIDAELLGNHPALVGGGVVAVEAGRHFLSDRGVGEQFAGKLFNGEPVVGHVLVERPDHPVAPAPHVAGAVGVVDAAVAIAGQVHPQDRQPFPVPRGCQQAIDHLPVSLG